MTLQKGAGGAANDVNVVRENLKIYSHIVKAQSNLGKKYYNFDIKSHAKQMANVMKLQFLKYYKHAIFTFTLLFLTRYIIVDICTYYDQGDVQGFE